MGDVAGGIVSERVPWIVMEIEEKSLYVLRAEGDKVPVCAWGQ